MKEGFYFDVLEKNGGGFNYLWVRKDEVRWLENLDYKPSYSKEVEPYDLKNSEMVLVLPTEVME